MPSHSEIHEAYTNGNIKLLKNASLIALQNAKALISKSNVACNLNKMKELNKEFEEVDGCLSQGDEFKKDCDFLFEIGRNRASCYNGMADDLIMLSAFEQLINYKLLSNGVVAHVIDRRTNSDLGRAQKDRPIIVSELTADTTFLPITLSPTILLKNKYVTYAAPSESALEGLVKLKERRNRSHFDAQIYAVSYYPKCFFDGFKYICETIEEDFNMEFDTQGGK